MPVPISGIELPIKYADSNLGQLWNTYALIEDTLGKLIIDKDEQFPKIYWPLNKVHSGN